MDGEKYRQFLSLVDGVIQRVGADLVLSASYGGTGGSIQVQPAAFEQIAGQREVSQSLSSGYNHRSIFVGGIKITALYEIPTPSNSIMPGDYIDLCCEISEEEIKTVLSEQTVVAAEAVSDG